MGSIEVCKKSKRAKIEGCGAGFWILSSFRGDCKGGATPDHKSGIKNVRSLKSSAMVYFG